MLIFKLVENDFETVNMYTYNPLNLEKSYVGLLTFKNDCFVSLIMATLHEQEVKLLVLEKW